MYFVSSSPPRAGRRRRADVGHTRRGDAARPRRGGHCARHRGTAGRRAGAAAAVRLDGEAWADREAWVDRGWVGERSAHTALRVRSSHRCTTPRMPPPPPSRVRQAGYAARALRRVEREPGRPRHGPAGRRPRGGRIRGRGRGDAGERDVMGLVGSCNPIAWGPISDSKRRIVVNLFVFRTT